jgi:hypothetical protein
MGKIIVFWIVVFFFFLEVGKGQEARVVFYNVENLFDTRDDSLTNDAEFLPGAERQWSNEKFYRKIYRIYKTLVALGQGEMPAIVGLCEIENRFVLDRLIFDTPLRQVNYRVIHRDSPDARGVDVAILYRPDIFWPDTAEWLRVPMPLNESTREILHVKGRLWGTDTIHAFVNHWPSRYGGAGGSAPKRLAAASTLAVAVKKILGANPASNIILMGDFNDEPGDESIQAIGKILANDAGPVRFSLVNLSAKTSFTDIEGTIKHQGTWSIFDQVLVSVPLYEGTGGCRVLSGKAEVFRADFLLEPDQNYTGMKPFRTFAGYSYNNGFSDHLPVSILIGKAVSLP